MRSVFAVLLVALAALAIAISPQKAVIVSFPDDTPNSVMDQAKDKIKEAGGIITHEYHLIKAFAAKAPANALETIQMLDSNYKAVVEEDQVVSINGDT